MCSSVRACIPHKKSNLGVAACGPCTLRIVLYVLLARNEVQQDSLDRVELSDVDEWVDAEVSIRERQCKVQDVRIHCELRMKTVKESEDADGCPGDAQAVDHVVRGSSKWGRTRGNMWAQLGSQPWIGQCGGRYDTQLVMCSSERVLCTLSGPSLA